MLDLFIAFEAPNTRLELGILGFEVGEFAFSVSKFVALFDVTSGRKNSENKHGQDHHAEYCSGHDFGESLQNRPRSIDLFTPRCRPRLWSASAGTTGDPLVGLCGSAPRPGRGARRRAP
jgi:hypothetical protein